MIWSTTTVDALPHIPPAEAYTEYSELLSSVALADTLLKLTQFLTGSEVLAPHIPPAYTMVIETPV